MGIKSDDFKRDVENMIPILKDMQPDYVDLVLMGQDINTASYDVLRRMRKLAQNYLHEAIMIEKDDIKEDMDEINKTITECEEIQDISDELEEIKRGNFDTDNISYGHPLYDLTSELSRIQRNIKGLNKKGKITGEITFDLSKLEIGNAPDLEQKRKDTIKALKRKLEIIERSQFLDRTLQSFMNKIASCTVSDSSYEIQKKRLRQKIDELEQQTI